MEFRNKILQGDVSEEIKKIPDNCIDTIVTSPPYYNLRDYQCATWEGGVKGCNHETPRSECKDLKDSKQSTNKASRPNKQKVCGKCGAIRVDRQIGLEDTVEGYVNKLIEVFRECRRILKPTGVFWLNLGDSYAGNNSRASNNGRAGFGEEREGVFFKGGNGIKAKDQMLIPHTVAIALRNDGWWLRDTVIWCLSGGVWVYVKTKKVICPMMVKDFARLKPNTVQVWNGQKWTNVLGVSKSKRRGDEIQFLLRSGERISCTPNHKFPTDKGLVEASNIKVGDVLQQVLLPDNDNPKDCALDLDAAWFAGLYLAEGSRSNGDCIQIAGHAKEEMRWERLQKIAKKYGGYITRTIVGNKMNIRLYGKILNAILDEFVSGRIARDKGFACVVWEYSNKFISAMVDGYLSGDGSWEESNHRWRIGFCRNYNLERDLRTACARLGYKLTLNLATAKMGDREFKSFRGEIRKFVSTHHSNRNQCEVVDIRKACCQYVYDIGVEDEPHVFALSSGILTHNSKSNPMPASVVDRTTCNHEYVFLLTKSPHYFYDAEAIKEDCITNDNSNRDRDNSKLNNTPGRSKMKGLKTNNYLKRNKRSVWHINTKPFKDSHFAVMPEELVMQCVLAGSSEKGCCPDCGKPWTRVIESTQIKRDRPNEYIKRKGEKGTGNSINQTVEGVETKTVGWEPQCKCEKEPVPCIVMDPFGGAMTTPLVAKKLGRDYVACELNPEYIKMGKRRIAKECGVKAEELENYKDDSKDKKAIQLTI